MSSIMGRVIRFRGGAHRDVSDVLPWYVAGQLDASETERVEAHLSVCAECQAEVRFQQRLGPEIAQIPLDVEDSWARMRKRIAEEAPAPRRARSAAPPLRPRTFAPPRAAAAVIRLAPAWGGWATAGAMLIAAVILLQPNGIYHAMGARSDAKPGNVLVMFRPETREQSLRETLKAAHARLVDGPTSADAYVLFVTPAERTRALAILRNRPDVVLAQPIDSGAAK